MMILDPTTVICASIRAVAAVPFGLALWRERQDPLTTAAQGLADASAVLFVLALTGPALRAAFGLWWVILFLYALLWEFFQFLGYMRNLMYPPVDNDQGVFTGWGWFGVMVWKVVGVALPIAAGFGLAFDAVAPNELRFPTTL